jgi:hypothetical protein
MSRHFLPVRFHRLGLLILNVLLRRSIRGCRIIWAALWRLLRKSPHLRHSLVSLPSSILGWKEAVCNRRGSSYSNVDVSSPSPCYGLIDPTELASTRGTEVGTGVALPFVFSQDPQLHFTASARTGDIITAELPAIPPACHLPTDRDRSSSSSASADNDDGHHGSEDNVPSRFSQTSTSSQTLNNVPLQSILVETRSGSGSLHSDVRPTTPVAHAPNIIPHMGSMGSRGSLWEISDYIWPMIPIQVPRYKNNRIM